MTPNLDLNEPADTATERPPPGPIGTWTIDHTHSSVALTWRKPRLGTVTGRLHCLGIVHVAVLPPVGMIRFDRPAVPPVLTMALDPASVDTGDAHLDTTLRGPGAFDVTRHHWWTLRSESLELLPTGTWRIMATLTARGTTALVELRVEVEASDPTGSSYAVGACSTGARSASATDPRSATPGSGSTWSCMPGA